MKISYYNVGCKVNFADISQIQEQFEKLGHRTVDFGEACDAVIINTCTVTKNADADCRKIIRRALKSNPDAFIGVVGCYSQVKPEEISIIDGVDAVFGTKEKFLIHEIIKEFKKTGETRVFVSDMDDIPYHSASSVDNETHTRLVLKIQDGCDYYCSYCAVSYARGKSRSMPFINLRKELLKLNESDTHEIILSGINLGEYKAPTGERFIDVVRLIDSLKLKQRFRISSIEPNLLTDELIRIVKESNCFCHHFHIPLQSGSNEILGLMKRRYKAETFSDLIIKIKREIPDCGIGVDVISGFPGETNEHFRETVFLLSSLPVSYLHSFTYSAREITPAAKMEGHVPKHIKKERTNLLRLLSDKKKLSFYKSQLGTIHSVIPEAINPATSRWKGWTENYLRVEFDYDLHDSVPGFANPENVATISTSGKNQKQMDNNPKEPVLVKLVELEGEIVVGEMI